MKRSIVTVIWPDGNGVWPDGSGIGKGDSGTSVIKPDNQEIRREADSGLDIADSGIRI